MTVQKSIGSDDGGSGTVILLATLLIVKWPTVTAFTEANVVTGGFMKKGAVPYSRY